MAALDFCCHTRRTQIRMRALGIDGSPWGTSLLREFLARIASVTDNVRGYTLPIDINVQRRRGERGALTERLPRAVRLERRRRATATGVAVPTIGVTSSGGCQARRAPQ